MPRYQNQPHIHLFREPMPQSIRELQFVHEIAEEFPRKTISPRTRKLLSLLIGREFVLPPQGAEIQTRLQRSQRIIYPLPDTGSSEHIFQVSGVDFFDYTPGNEAVGIELYDPNGILQAQRDIFLRRMGRESTRSFVPHIKVATVAQEDATSDILSWVQDRAPHTVTLDAILTHPSIAPPSLPQITRRADTSPVAEASIARPSVQKVARIDDVKLPQALIDAMKNRNN